jgi:hypothetical protein
MQMRLGLRGNGRMLAVRCERVRQVEDGAPRDPEC